MQMKAVLIIEGDAAEANCAIPELIDICRGYGLKIVDIVKEYPEGCQCRK